MKILALATKLDLIVKDLKFLAINDLEVGQHQTSVDIRLSKTQINLIKRYLQVILKKLEEIEKQL